MTIDLTTTQLLVGVGGLIALVAVWRLGSKAAKRAAEAARTGARALSLGGRVLLWAAAILGAQWVVLTRTDNDTLQLVVLALPDLFAGLLLTRALTLTVEPARHRGGGRR